MHKHKITYELFFSGLNKSELPNNMDGLDMWKTISEGVPSPRTELLYNLDDVFQYGAIRQGEWKYTYGSTNNGKADHWFGNDGKNPAYHYDKNLILNSQVNTALSGVITYQQIAEKNKNIKHQLDNNFTINLIDENVIDKLRDQAVIRCKPHNSEDQLEQNKCNLLESPCLFNIKDDPCERNNLASQRPNIVLNMEQLIMKHRKTAIAPRNVPRDPNADPAKWNGTWTNWLDCENVVRQKLHFNALSPLAIGLISAAGIAVFIIIITLSILNCKHAGKKVRSSYDNYEAAAIDNSIIDISNRKEAKDKLFEDKEVQAKKMFNNLRSV